MWNKHLQVTADYTPAQLITFITQIVYTHALVYMQRLLLLSQPLHPATWELSIGHEAQSQ